MTIKPWYAFVSSISKTLSCRPTSTRYPVTRDPIAVQTQSLRHDPSTHDRLISATRGNRKPLDLPHPKRSLPYAGNGPISIFTMLKQSITSDRADNVTDPDLGNGPQCLLPTLPCTYSHQTPWNRFCPWLGQCVDAGYQQGRVWSSLTRNVLDFRFRKNTGWYRVLFP